jgi:hypothetical protein
VWIKRKAVAAVVICVVLAAASFAFWQMNQSAQAAMVYPHPGLVGWWRFDEGSGTVASDSSGYGNNGTINNATWATGIYGQALSFDGVNDFALGADNPSLDFPGDYSIMAWIKRTGDGGVVWQKGCYGGSAVGPILYVDGGKVYFGNGAWGANPQLLVSVASISTAWTHVVGLRNGTAYRIYINGELDNSGTRSNRDTSNTFNWDVGARTNNGQGLFMPFNGTIDEVRVFNRALSAAEIREYYQKSPDFSSNVLAKIPKGTTQVMTTLSWQGIGTTNVTIQSPSTTYNETTVPVYQKTVYSTSDGTSSMLNIKRLSVSVAALSSDENWYIVLEFENVYDYRITVEIQK